MQRCVGQYPMGTAHRFLGRGLVAYSIRQSWEMAPRMPCDPGMAAIRVETYDLAAADVFRIVGRDSAPYVCKLNNRGISRFGTLDNSGITLSTIQVGKAAISMPYGPPG